MKKFAYGLACLALVGLSAGCSGTTTNQATSNPTATSPVTTSPTTTSPDKSSGGSTGATTTMPPAKAETVVWSGQSAHFKLDITLKSVATDTDFKFQGQGQAPSCSPKGNTRVFDWELTYLGDHPDQLHSIDFKTGGVPKYLNLLPPDMQMTDPRGLQKVLMGQKAPLCLNDQEWAHLKSDLSNEMTVMVNTGPGTTETFTVKTSS